MEETDIFSNKGAAEEKVNDDTVDISVTVESQERQGTQKPAARARKSLEELERDQKTKCRSGTPSPSVPGAVPESRSDASFRNGSEVAGDRKEHPARTKRQTLRELEAEGSKHNDGTPRASVTGTVSVSKTDRKNEASRERTLKESSKTGQGNIKGKSLLELEAEQKSNARSEMTRASAPCAVSVSEIGPSLRAGIASTQIRGTVPALLEQQGGAFDARTSSQAATQRQSLLELEADQKGKPRPGVKRASTPGAVSVSETDPRSNLKFVPTEATRIESSAQQDSPKRLSVGSDTNSKKRQTLLDLESDQKYNSVPRATVPGAVSVAEPKPLPKVAPSDEPQPISPTGPRPTPTKRQTLLELERNEKNKTHQSGLRATGPGAVSIDATKDDVNSVTATVTQQRGSMQNTVGPRVGAGKRKSLLELEAAEKSEARDDKMRASVPGAFSAADGAETKDGREVATLRRIRQTLLDLESDRRSKSQNATTGASKPSIVSVSDPSGEKTVGKEEVTIPQTPSTLVRAAAPAFRMSVQDLESSGKGTGIRSTTRAEKPGVDSLAASSLSLDTGKAGDGFVESARGEQLNELPARERRDLHRSSPSENASSFEIYENYPRAFQRDDHVTLPSPELPLRNIEARENAVGVLAEEEDEELAGSQEAPRGVDQEEEAPDEAVADGWQDSFVSRDGDAAPAVGDIEASEELVLEADTVLEATNVEVTTDDYKNLGRRRKKACLCLVGIIVVVIVALVTALQLTDDGGKVESLRTNSPTIAPSAMPSTVPSASPTSSDLVEIMQILRLVYANDAPFQEAFSDRSSPQNRAAKWITEEDLLQNVWSDRPRLIQRFALATFYFSLGGDEWFICSRDDATCGLGTGKRSWLSAFSECEWDSVECDDDGYVTQIFFDTRNIVGFVSTPYGLTGTLPYELSFVARLTILVLEKNFISGSIPDWDGFSNLRVIRLGFNQLTGSLPLRLFLRSTELSSFHANDNNLTDTVPWESLPESLVDLELQNNNLEGPIERIEALTRMQGINVENNALTGSIPTQAFYLPEIRRLRFGGNPLLVLELGEFVGNATTLRELTLFGSPGFQGTLPDELYNLDSLRLLNLADSGFSGTLSEDFSKMTQLQSILLHNNSFAGGIPAAFDSMTQIRDLLLHFNQITGTISEDICSRRGLFQSGQIQNLTADCAVLDNATPKVSCTCCSCF